MKRNLLSILFLVGIAPAMLGQQLKIDRIELMPNKPEPYIMRDWKQVAIGYDSLVYDVTKKGRQNLSIRLCQLLEQRCVG